jgi:hypothetical protein
MSHLIFSAAYVEKLIFACNNLVNFEKLEIFYKNFLLENI